MSDTQVTRREARALDRALAGDIGHDDPDGLIATATQLRGTFDIEVPDARRERAMFVSGVATRRHGFNPLRAMVPALAFLLLVAIAYLGGRTALPGDSLYPVRQALGSVGLADSPTEEIDARIGEAGSLLSKAERSLDSNPGTSLRLAVEALEALGPAIDLLDELEGNELETRTDAIDALESRAVDVIGAVTTVGQDDNDESSGDGSSGSSGDDDRSGSNSGPGSGEDRSDDDNSGPGDADDTRSDDGDNSGPGSDGEDRSGSDSGSDSIDNNSGSGTDSSDDNSGPGSGDEDPELSDVDEGRDGSGDDSGSNSGPGGGDDIDDDGINFDDEDDAVR